MKMGWEEEFNKHCAVLHSSVIIEKRGNEKGKAERTAEQFRNMRFCEVIKQPSQKDNVMHVE
jgi:hypothetical protein